MIYPTKDIVSSAAYFNSQARHETHTEFLEIISGAALITLNNSTRIYTASDGIITIPRYAKHEWQRASRAPDLGFDFFDDSSPENNHTYQEMDDELIVREWTQPSDGKKEIFFRNLSGIISHSTQNGHPDWYVTLQLWILFATMDNWPVFFRAGNVPVFGGWIERLGIARILEWGVTHVLLGVAGLVGRVSGVKGVWGAFTPEMVDRREGGEKRD
ncbi:hypothetical protein ACEPPN_011883 [Leptodophora sp. 'Broadleaf-Isolate-01']